MSGPEFPIRALAAPVDLSQSGCFAVCKPRWKVLDNTNAVGAQESDSFTVPDVETCLYECARVPNCVAVDVNVDDYPLQCWPHFQPSHLRDNNIFSQQGTNHYQLTGSCAPSEPITTNAFYFLSATARISYRNSVRPSVWLAWADATATHSLTLAIYYLYTHSFYHFSYLYHVDKLVTIIIRIRCKRCVYRLHSSGDNTERHERTRCIDVVQCDQRTSLSGLLFTRY